MKDEVQHDDLDTIQRGIEDAAKKIKHKSQSDSQKDVRKTPEQVAVREGAATRSFSPVERRVLMKQARKARARAREVQHGAWQKNIVKKASERTVRDRQFHKRQRCQGQRTTETTSIPRR